MHGHVHWNELNTHDSEKARAFYGNTLGWEFEGLPMEDGSTYWIIMMNGARVGGIFEMVHPAFADIPEHWFTHFEVDDIHARVKAVTDNGGMITRAPFEIPGTGTIAVLQSASGSYCAFIEPVRG